MTSTASNAKIHEENGPDEKNISMDSVEREFYSTMEILQPSAMEQTFTTFNTNSQKSLPKIDEEKKVI